MSALVIGYLCGCVGFAIGVVVTTVIQKGNVHADRELGCYAVKRRLERLEVILEVLKSKQERLKLRLECGDGNHEWEALKLSNDKAALRCKHCFKQKESR